MKILKFLYHMEIQFDKPVKEHHFTLKCIPHSGQGQLVESVSSQVYPNRYISRSSDSFSNECIYGYCGEEHDHFMVDVEGVVRTGMERIGGECEDPPKSIFKYQTPHTMPGPQIEAYHKTIRKELESMIDRPGKGYVENMVLFYMHRLHQDFAYESGTTGIETTAEKAFGQGRGVCQDYTHILLGLLRLENIPCRYVTGMLEGEGLSHAWVEFYSENGWSALDPTNDKRVTDEHISISRGRDYRDCRLNQGVFTGCNGKVGQHQTIRVEVKEIG